MGCLVALITRPCSPIPITENDDVAVWQPSLGSKRGTKYIMLAGDDVRRARELTRRPALGADTRL
jgi:hypothetical protein